ncbi:MAG: SPOR domain-containing protein [Balneolaceae bacterium]
MHLDHSKLVELLVEATGIEKAKVVKHLKELVKEISQAIEEGEAYELEGFGIFSGIGNNIIFIEDAELATEINYKYVGMEPIELEDSSSPEKSSAETVQDDEDLDEDDPFGGLLDEEVSEEEEIEEEEAEPVNTSEEETAEEEPSHQDTPEEEETAETEDSLLSETEEELIPEEHPGPEKWGIDTYKDDSAGNTFSGMLGKYEDENSESVDEDPFAEETEQESTSEDELRIQFDAEAARRDQQETEEDDEDFDDPFKGLTDDDDPEEEDLDEDPVPVITNISSDAETNKKPKEKKREKPLTSAKKRQGSPAMLWVFLIIVLLGGGVFGLGYFGIVDIPGVSPETVSTPIASNTSATSTESESAENQASNAATTQQQEQAEAVSETLPQREEEQSAGTPVSETVEAEANPDQPLYGLNGVPLSEANNGYTIVVYSLSKESNANNQKRILSNAGFRVLVTSQSSSQYGRLWRVSLGQFESLREAALAAETLKKPHSENYFITKIQ